VKVIAGILVIGILVGTAIANGPEFGVVKVLFTEGPKAAIEAIKERLKPDPPNTPEKVEEINKTDVPLFLKYINTARETHGVKPLTLDEKLCEVARYRAQKMMEWGFVGHNIPNVGKAKDTLEKFNIPAARLWIGENAGIYTSEQKAHLMHDDFMASEGHKANIISPHYTRLGVGIAIDQFGNKWVMQIFVGP